MGYVKDILLRTMHNPQSSVLTEISVRFVAGAPSMGTADRVIVRFGVEDNRKKHYIERTIAASAIEYCRGHYSNMIDPIITEMIDLLTA